MGPSDTSIGTYLTPFPKGFRMISGTAMSRYDNDIKTLGVAYDYYATGSQAPNATGKFLPNGTNTGDKVPSTIRTMITFPSCGWANQTLDTNNHFDHMTWPIEAGGGHGWYAPRIGSKCPASHPIKCTGVSWKYENDTWPRTQGYECEIFFFRPRASHIASRVILNVEMNSTPQNDPKTLL
jgi:hypothetical protein